VHAPRVEPDGDLLGQLLQSHGDGFDGLRLTSVPFVPGAWLHLASDAIVLEARLATRPGHRLAPPLWADVWAGGQALARHIMVHPELVADRVVLDVASGCGIVAIAAAIAGAAHVTANDIDPYALAAIELNARSSGVTIEVIPGDMLDGDGGGADVVLAGDAFYSEPMVERMTGFLDRAASRGAEVLAGDPGRDSLPWGRFDIVAGYPLGMAGAGMDAQLRQAYVLRPNVGARP
jgi:predicted nicotinamide N-methyase